MAETVSKLVRVRQGRIVVQFELTDSGLVVEYYKRINQRPIRIMLGQAALRVLQELLTGAPPATIDVGPGQRPPGSVPKEGLQGKRTAEGLVREEDGVESGMA